MIYYERSILPKSVFAGSFFITFADTLDLISFIFTVCVSLEGLCFCVAFIAFFFDDHE